MKRVETGNPRRLVYREPCGWGVLITLPLFVAVVGFGWFLGFTLLDGFADWPPLGQLATVGVGLLMAVRMVLWGVEWFGCVGVALDRDRGVAVPRWGLFLPVGLVSHPLEKFFGLVLDVITTIHSTNGSETFREYTFVLYLLGENGKRVRIGRSREYVLVRAMAEDVGRFLGLPVLDASGDEPVVLPASRLGLSLKEKARLEPPREVPPAPPGLRSKYRVEGERIVVEMPRQSNSGCLAVWFLLLAGLLGLLAYIFIDSEGSWAPVAIFGAVGGIVLAILYEAIAPQQTVLEVSPRELCVRKLGLVFTSERRLPAERIREVRPGLLDITVLTDRETVSFGLYLGEEELKWIHELLLRVLAA
jgi:hypothetical protein